MIYQPDQAEGFPQDIVASIVITILRELVIRALRILTDKDAIFERHLFPFPTTTVTPLAGGKEASNFDDLPATLLDLAGQQITQLAQSRIRERARKTAVFEQAAQVEIFDPNQPVAVRKPGGHLVEHIVSHAGDAVVQACHLSSRLFPVF